MKRLLWVLCMSLWVCVPRVVYAQETVPEAVLLGFNPAENAQTLQRSADALAGLLSARIQLPVRAVVTLDYTTLVEAMRNGHVHFAWLTPSPLVLAERLVGVEVLLTQVRRGSPTYFSALVVREDSRFHTVEDLRGRSIAWVDPTSTSGFVIPRYLLLERGLDPSRFFTRQVFAGGHDTAVIAVQRGQVDAAAVWADPPDERTGAWTRYLRAHPTPRLRPILYSPPVPSDAIAVTRAFRREHPLLVRSVSAALVSIGESEEGRGVLRELNATDGFVAANPAQYALVRRAFEATRDARVGTRSGAFEHPRDVAFFGALVALLAVLAWLGRRTSGPRLRVASWALFLLCLGWSAAAATIPAAEFARGFGRIVEFLRGMFPPDRGVAAEVLEATVLTIRLALVGTVLGVPAALVLGFLAAENVTPSRGVRAAARFVCNLDRSVDLLIVGLILVSAYGPGAFPGVGALAVHTVGSLGKQFYETLETMDPGPVEAMTSVGGTRLQVLRWGVWPQFAPHFVSQALFRFELNVRGAVVLGLVGAQGIGFLLQTYMRGAEYAKVTVVVAAIVALVMALDAVSSRLRRQVR
ncbi:MAG: phosphonate ABC transporter, permease protein PhnE [Deltaproteobacteria bacterium]|nr:phosphonate ABC transporter, permease protein PhnE [Deltaproteobacteria bacterium]